jgi:hypothetical protein
MKFLMKVGDELDLNVSYDGGAVDGVGYEVPATCADIISVNAAGIVEALALGEGVVNVTSAGAVIGSIVFSVLSQAAYDAQQAIRGGDKELVVEAEEVPQAPVFTLVTDGSPIGYSNSGVDGPEYAFDGNDYSGGSSRLWVSLFAFGQNTESFIGKRFPQPKQIKKIRVQWITAPTEVYVMTSNNSNLPEQVLATIQVTYQDFNEQQPAAYQEIILPDYAPVTGIWLKAKTVTAVPDTYWASNGGVIDRFRIGEIKLYE